MSRLSDNSAKRVAHDKLQRPHLKKVVILPVLLALFFFMLGCSDRQKDQRDISERAQSRANPSFLSSNGQVADPTYKVRLPLDHLPHPSFDIEWWYLTANLTGSDGEEYALQWTLFRFAQSEQQNAWYQGQMFMAHASLHSSTKHWFAERFAPGGTGNSYVKRLNESHKESGAIALRMDDWLWQGLDENGALFPSTLSTHITGNNRPDAIQQNAKIDLVLKPHGPYVLQGDDGYSIKSADGSHASHYYSLPFIEASGELVFGETSVTVSGVAWYDHEWSSTLVNGGTQGWDWMSLHFDNGDKLMAFRMRLTDEFGQSQDYQTGTFIKANGVSRSLGPQEIFLSERSRTQYKDKAFPLEWEVLIPSENIRIDVQARKAEAYNNALFPYYEGAVRFDGSHQGKGFLELTGY